MNEKDRVRKTDAYHKYEYFIYQLFTGMNNRGGRASLENILETVHKLIDYIHLFGNEKNMLEDHRALKQVLEDVRRFAKKDIKDILLKATEDTWKGKLSMMLLKKGDRDFTLYP